MSKKKLHPSVQKFKEFVKEHPNLIKEVRAGHFTWQELYEDWYLLGEEDARWEPYKEGKGHKTEVKKETSKEWFPQILGAIKNMDPNQVQGHIANLSQALGAIQGVISQFHNGNQEVKNQGGEPKITHPFHFRKD
ncbi:YlbD family protein [Bacillus dakarensis]|uniref:YlbD family protein n=1 Tax=Robertmurraya dakarensis TaxID=1926278 RepID=UPI0009819C59|nr:YlbD family protein [Bacillus dakarensis]